MADTTTAYSSSGRKIIPSAVAKAASGQDISKKKKKGTVSEAKSKEPVATSSPAADGALPPLNATERRDSESADLRSSETALGDQASSSPPLPSCRLESVLVKLIPLEYDAQRRPKWPPKYDASHEVAYILYVAKLSPFMCQRDNFAIMIHYFTADEADRAVTALAQHPTIADGKMRISAQRHVYGYKHTLAFKLLTGYCPTLPELRSTLKALIPRNFVEVFAEYHPFPQPIVSGYSVYTHVPVRVDHPREFTLNGNKFEIRPSTIGMTSDQKIKLKEERKKKSPGSATTHYTTSGLPSTPIVAQAASNQDVPKPTLGDLPKPTTESQASAAIPDPSTPLAPATTEPIDRNARPSETTITNTRLAEASDGKPAEANALPPPVTTLPKQPTPVGNLT